MHRLYQVLFIYFLLNTVQVIPALGQIRLPFLISDGMVLQRGVDTNIWGWANPNDEIQIDFNGIKLKTMVDSFGKWNVTIPSMPAGGPFEIRISNSDEEIEIRNILLGDVWLCSGQSNMETTMERVEPMFPDEFSNIENLKIRYFDVPDDYTFTEVKDDLKGGKWLELNEENIRSFAAVAYFFAKNLNQKYDVPIGMVNASVGGSPIQSWLREEDLKEFPKDYQEALHFQTPGVIEEIERTDKEKIDYWRNELRSKDLGLLDKNLPWFSNDFEPNDWQKMHDVDFWPLDGNRSVNGVFWFRKVINIDFDPSEASEIKLLLGTLVDSDQAYINGQLVGSTGYRYPPRRYNVPNEVLKKGKNILVVRIVSENGRGGFIKEKPYVLQIGEKRIDLSKDWQYQVGAIMEKAPNQTTIRFKPMGLYNAMIAPLHKVTFKGILWYQGESNAGQAELYEKQLISLINGWREEWKKPKLPFLYVQLPNFMEVVDQPQESEWAEMREVQRKTLAIPHTGMAITIDVGEANDIHPLDKKTVGDRLALQAAQLVYGEKDGPFSGPLLQKSKIKKDRIVLTFTETGKGLNTSDMMPVSGIALAGKDGEFKWVNGTIAKKNKVIIKYDTRQRPFMLRYAWANNPEWANLINSIKIPASPFEVIFSEL
ncbi:sialate O-acetylesterase [Belliella sp. R4-6]|uniref:Sialate O-acetylesterase n=1 Tax=Belliella alkalica TaxID=1730871 RepID=A0ABS9V8G7_9BACT|nr:sialate O-acetylesterase [Belliella alkalica]MCH7412410.1 sialate O-acetylesterase [Belliella alkalica]